MLIRGLNSILRQAPYVADASSPAYNPRDVSDLLFYTRTWCRTVTRHHVMEESTFFPLVEEATGIPGLMDDLEVEHEEFFDGLITLQNYVTKVSSKPDTYRWAKMRIMIQSFSPALVSHLHSEIDFLLGIEKFGTEVLNNAWLETEKVTTKVEDKKTLTEVLPFVFGCCDATYEGGDHFPEVPKALRQVIKHGFAKKHRGAWRFNPCDFMGVPRPLQMLPENRL